MGRRLINSFAKFFCAGLFSISAVPAISQDIAAPVSAQIGQTLLLDPSDRVVLPSGEPLSIEWSWQDRPATSVAAFSDVSALRPAVTLDIAGTYTARATFLTQAGVIVGEADVIFGTENFAPVAGIRQRSVPGSDTVTLDASPSLDVDGDSVSYEWSLIAPSGSALPTSSSQALWDVQPDIAGTYTAELVVVDSLGQRSNAATTEFLAIESPQGLALANTPVAAAQFDGQVQSAGSLITLNPTGSAPSARLDVVTSSVIGQPLTLNGRRSFDLNGEALDYNWALLSAPNNSVSFLSPSGPGQASLNPDVLGDYVVQLSVNDPMGATSFATQLIRVDQPLPTADAGRDQSVTDTFAHLNGTGSTLPHRFSCLKTKRRLSVVNLTIRQSVRTCW